MANAGNAVGLIAGVVGAVYVAGGLVIALRMLLNGSSVAESVGVVGEFPREHLITAGFVQVVGFAAVVGLVAGLVVASGLNPEAVRPRRRAHKDGQHAPDMDNLKAPRFGVPTAVLLVPLTVAFLTPVLWAWWWEEDQKFLRSLVFIVALAAQYAAILIGWITWRRMPANWHRHRRKRGLYTALVWACMALPAGAAFAGFLGFEPARVCLRDPTEPTVDGELVADTPDAVLLTAEHDGDDIVVRIPADQVASLRYGAFGLPSC